MAMHDTVALYQHDQHPRMFFSPWDVDTLRDKAKTSLGSSITRELIRRCEEHLTPGNDHFVDFNLPRDELMGEGHWGCPLHAPMHHFAFAALITREKQYLDAAVKLLEIITRGEPINTKYPYGHNYRYDAPEPIVIANLGGNIPLAYDMLFDQLDDALRTQAQNFMRHRIVEPYRKTLIHQRLKYAQGLGLNPPWHEMFSFGWTLAAIYQHDRPEDRQAMEEVADLVRRSIHMGVDETGVIGEGVNYGRLDTYRWVTNALILRRAGVYDFWENEPRFNRMIEHWVHLLLPGLEQVYNRGDMSTSYHQDAVWPLAIHAGITRDPAVQHAWITLGARKQLEELGTHPGLPTSLGFMLLWDDPTLEPRHPDQVGYPLTKMGGTFGEHLMRTGWGEDDTFFCLLGAGRKLGCYIHQHADAGHFSLFSHGESYAIETGYGDLQACHHNLLMPMGHEPPRSPVIFDQVWPGGHNHATGSATHIDYACVDIAWMWDCNWNYRHGWLIKAPGAEPYALLVDNCNHRGEYAYYDWLLNTSPDNRIELNEADLAATLHGRRHHLDVRWALPDEHDYPAGHRLELRQDVFPSTPQVRTKRMSYGMGERPRLIARLFGYNGIMMTALMPRREGQASAKITRFGESYHFGMTIDFGDFADTIVCNPVDGFLNIANLGGEATLAIVRRDKSGRIAWWSATQGYALAADGQVLLPRQGEPVTIIDGTVPAVADK